MYILIRYVLCVSDTNSNSEIYSLCAISVLIYEMKIKPITIP